MKIEKQESEKLLGARYRHSIYKVGGYYEGYEVVRVSNLSLYLNPRWTVLGIVLLSSGIIISILGRAIYTNGLLQVGYFVMGAGSSIIIAQVTGIPSKKTELKWKKREIIKEQCYAWLLGVSIALGTLFPPDDEDKELKKEVRYMEILGFLNGLSISENQLFGKRPENTSKPWNSKLWTFPYLYQAIHTALGFEWHKGNFFKGGAYIVAMSYLLNPEKNQSTLDEIETIFPDHHKGIVRIWVKNLSEYNNPIITWEFITEIFRLIDNRQLHEAIEKAYMVKDYFEIWENNTFEI